MICVVGATSAVGYGEGFFGRLLAVLIPSAAGVVAYIILATILKTDETKMFFDIFKKRSVKNGQ